VNVACKYFVASPSDVPRAFPGWLAPLRAPETRHLHNPFTEEPIFKADGTPFLITTRRPLGPWLERPGCPVLSAFHPIDLWPISSMDVALLGMALGGMGPAEPEGALFAPEDFGWTLHRIPDGFVGSLAEVASAPDAVRVWHGALRQRPGDYFTDLDADVADWVIAVDRLVQLSRYARSRSYGLFVYQGPDPEVQRA
jgi:hypothetical protein